MKLPDIFAMVLHEANLTGQITTDWVDQTQTVLIQRFVGDWSWQNCFWGLIKARRWITKSNRRVDFIFDLTESGRFPKALRYTFREEWLWQRVKWPKLIGRIVVVGGGQQISELFDLRCKIAPETMKYFRRVNTLEEAFALLKTWVLDDDAPPFDEIAI